MGQQIVATRRQEIEADRKSNEEFINQRRADAHARVAATAIEKWNTTESGYRDIQKRHENSASVRETKAKEELKEYKKKNAEERKKFETAHASLQNSFKVNVSRRLQNAGDSIGSTSPLARSLSESQIQVLDANEGHRKIVAMNRRHLQQAHAHAQMQELEK